MANSRNHGAKNQCDHRPEHGDTIKKLSFRLFSEPFILSSKAFYLSLVPIDLSLLLILSMFLTHELVTD